MVKIMEKALRLTGRILLGIVWVTAVLLLASFVNNKTRSVLEKKYLDNQIYGQKVEVDGADMSVYVAGEGEHTLVFMAGAGDPAPILGYKSFIDRFEKDYKVVVIEKFGYGYSDETDGPRDVGTRVRQDREALKAAGVEGPYVLCPHSYSGLETVYWAQSFPDEVEAIIGLDMAVPASYDMYDEESIRSQAPSYFWNRVGREAGIVRLIAVNSIPDGYSDDEVNSYMALVCTRYCNKTVEREGNYLISDRTLIESKKMPDVPTLLIISDGTIADGWIDLTNAYASSISDVTTVQLNCGHSVYRYEPDKCGNAMREFLNGLEK